MHGVQQIKLLRTVVYSWKVDLHQAMPSFLTMNWMTAFVYSIMAVRAGFSAHTGTGIQINFAVETNRENLTCEKKFRGSNELRKYENFFTHIGYF